MSGEPRTKPVPSLTYRPAPDRAPPLPADLRRRIRQARKAQGLSLRQAAARLGVCYSYVANVELGDRCPRRRVVEALIDVLGLDDDAARQLRACAAPEGRYGRR